MKVTIRLSSRKDATGRIAVKGKVVRVVDKPSGVYEVAMQIEKRKAL
jgi:hypothetical protein